METHSEREVNIHPMKNTKQIIRRALTAALASAMLVSSMAGCAPKQNTSSKGDASSTAPTGSSGESKTEFDAKAITNGKKLTLLAKEKSDTGFDYKTNEQTKQIEEELGVELEFTTAPAADYETKINVMVNGDGDLPDIVSDPGGNLYVWGKKGAFLPLKKYYDDANFSANIRAGSEASGIDITKEMTQPDGEIYGAPRLIQMTAEETARKTWVYKPWLDKFGLKVPETTDEFYEACKKIVEGDANGNGKKDEIAISGTGIDQWFQGLMSAFIYSYDGEYRVLGDDGKLKFAYDTEEWKQGLKYVRKFFAEGLIPTEVLTQDWNQYRASLDAEDQTVFAFNYYNGDCISADLMDRRLNYTWITALKGPSGKKEAFYNPSKPYAGAAISANCKDPDAAFLLLDYMCSTDQSITQRYGQQGVDWNYSKDVEGYKAENYITKVAGATPSIIIDNKFWTNPDQNRSYKYAFSLILPKTITDGALQDTTGTDEASKKLVAYAEQAANMFTDMRKDAYTKPLPNMPLTEDESDEISEPNTALKSYVKEATCAFLVGEKDIDKDWDSYLAEFDKIGYKRILEVYQAAYDRVK